MQASQSASSLCLFSVYNPEICYKPVANDIQVSTPLPDDLEGLVKEVHLVGQKIFVYFQKHHCAMCGHFPHSAGGTMSVQVKIPQSASINEFKQFKNITLEQFRAALVSEKRM